MIYHFLDFIIPYVLGIDFLLIGLLYLSIKLKGETARNILYTVAVLGFVGLSLFKWLASSPGSVASTPAGLNIKTNQPLTTIYYLSEGKKPLRVFWKDLLVGQQSVRSFETESDVGNGLYVAKQLNGEVGYQVVQLDYQNRQTVDLKPENFKTEENERVAEAIQRYRWTELGNYLSHWLTLAFVGGLIWRTSEYGF